MQESAQSNLGLEQDQMLADRGDQAKRLLEIPLLEEVFKEDLQSLAVQLATLEPLQRDDFTVLKAQYIAIKNIYERIDGFAQQGDEARARLAGEGDKTGIL